MSVYPPPSQFLPTFNQNEFNYASSSLTYTEADARYLKLTGGIESGLVTFNAGLTSSSSINVAYAVSTPWTAPSYTFTGATDAGLYYDTDGVNYRDNGLAVSGKYLFVSGLLTPSNAAYTSFYNYDTTYLGGFYCNSSSGAGVFRIASATNFAAISFSGSSTTNLALPTTSDTLTGNASAQTIQNKTFQTSSNTDIASFTATTITTSFVHNLVVNDIIRFPYIGSMSGIAVATPYTVATTPTTTSFTLTGIAGMGGTVNNAYYIITSRPGANIGSAGGLLHIEDATSLQPVFFDTSGATAASVFQCQATGPSCLRYTLPGFGGTFMMLNNTQVVSGIKTFATQVALTRAGNIAASSAGLYSNPASTTMTAANNYYFNYFTTPPSTGTSTGTSSTVVIAGATSTATNNYSLQILAGQSSLPAGTVAAPAIVFGTSNSSGFYSASANTINTSISGVNVHQVNSTGLTVAGITQSSTSVVTPTLRPVSGNSITSAPATNSAAGTAQLLITPSSAGWATNGTAELDLGDTSHSISAVNGTGMTLLDTNGMRFGSTGNYFVSMQHGAPAYSVSLAALGYVTVAVSFTNTFASAPSKVLVTLNLQGAATYWDQCSVQAISITTTGFSAAIRNNNPTNATSGTTNISYIAIQ